MRIECFLPEKVLTNKELSQEFPDWDSVSFEKKIGIRNRHIVEDNETALDLAYQASLKVLANYDKSKIDFVLFCTQSPDYFLPTSACILQSKLNLSNRCGALDFNLGCSGYIYGLSIVKGLLASGVAKHILFVVSETYSKHIHPKDRTNRSIFGDASAATIYEEKDLSKLGSFILNTDGNGYEKLIVKNGGLRNKYDCFVQNKEYGTGNVFSDNHLYMNGPDIFNFTIEEVPQLVEDTLIANSIDKNEVDFFVFHQANLFMLNFLRRKIKIPKDKFLINMKETGNTVSATIPIVLSDALKNKVITKGDKVMLVGFGVGLSYGATIIKI